MRRNKSRYWIMFLINIFYCVFAWTVHQFWPNNTIFFPTGGAAAPPRRRLMVVKTGNFLPSPRDSETKQCLLFSSSPFPLLITISKILSASRPFHYFISSPLPSCLLFLSSFASPPSPPSCWNTCLFALMVNLNWEKKYFYFKTGCKMEQKRKVILSWLILIFCKYFLQCINFYFQFGNDTSHSEINLKSTDRSKSG